MRSKLRLAIWTAAALVLAVGSVEAQTSGEPERFSAWAVNMTSSAMNANATMEIRIDRWSPRVEYDRLIETLTQKGADAMLRRLQESPELGFMRLPTQVGKRLHFALQMQTEEGGRRILVLTDREITVNETHAQPRSIDYPFILIELSLDRHGAGEGILMMAAKISHNETDNSIEFEDFGNAPVQLRNVKAEPVER